ncbi:MAG: hypothetical protein JSS72_11740 [Armatimonadetes bacterium]|nr:hypothetical protein [Armatimonadota bacterium]
MRRDLIENLITFAAGVAVGVTAANLVRRNPSFTQGLSSSADQIARNCESAIEQLERRIKGQNAAIAS